VAAYVASDMADVSFGVEAAARQFDLDFVTLLTEDYVFVCLKTMLDTAPMKRVLGVLRSAEFHAAVSALPGYAIKDSGMVKPVRDVFRKQPVEMLDRTAVAQ
jgi:molybdate-binding protein